MAKATKFVGNILMFLAGIVAGILLSIHGIAVIVTADSAMEKLNPIFMLPYTYYVLAIMAMVGLSVMLRKAADRII